MTTPPHVPGPTSAANTPQQPTDGPIGQGVAPPSPYPAAPPAPPEPPKKTVFVSRRPQLLPRLTAPVLREDGASFDQPLPLVRKASREVVGLQLGRRGWFDSLVFFAILAIFLFAASTVAVLTPGTSPRAATLIGSVGELIGAIVAFGVAITWVERRRHPVELRGSGFAVGLGAGLATGFLLIWVSVAAMMLVGAWRIVGRNPNYTFSWYDLITLGFVAGIAEEIMFRWIFFRILERSLGTWLSAVISGGVFGLVHLSNPDATIAGAAGIVLAGMMLAFMYAATRSLWFVMAVHAAWNLTQGPVVGSAVSGTGDPNGFLLSEPAGSALFNGGKFGLEASLPTAIVLAIVTAALAWYLHRRNVVTKPLWTRRRTNPIMQAAYQGHPVEEADHLEVQPAGGQVAPSGTPG